MGKNRRNSPSLPQNEPTYYSKYTEKEVPMGTLDDRQMSDFFYHLRKWLDGHGNSPDEGMSVEELEYVFDHMNSTENSQDIVPDGHLYRIENAAHFTEQGLSVGDTIPSKEAYRSFSKDILATNTMLENGWRGQTDIVIYRTNGNAPFFDTRDYYDPYSYQRECFVPIGTMKISNINEYSQNNLSKKEMINGLNSDYGLHVENYLKYAPFFNEGHHEVNSITVVDIEYDPSITEVTSSEGHTVRVQPPANSK